MTLKLVWWLDWFSLDRESFFSFQRVTWLPCSYKLKSFACGFWYFYLVSLQEQSKWPWPWEILQICNFRLILLQITAAQWDNRLAKGINQTSDLLSRTQSATSNEGLRFLKITWPSSYKQAQEKKITGGFILLLGSLGNSSSNQRKFCSFLADRFVFLTEVTLPFGDLGVCLI